MDLPDSPRPAPSTSTTATAVRTAGTASVTDEAEHAAAQEDLALPRKRRGLDLSLSQIIGGSLAAATAAALSAKLGVAGTIVGAAVISLVTALAGALYTQSLRRTQARVRAAAARVTPAQPARGRKVGSGRSSAEPVDVPDPDDDPVLTTGPGRHSTLLAGLNPRRVALAAVAVFALALAGLTGFELATGQSVSGAQGTTVGELTGGSGAESTGDEDDPAREPGRPTEATTPTPSEDNAATTPAPSTDNPDPTPSPSEEPTPTTPAPSPTLPEPEPEPEPAPGAGG